MPEFKSLEDGKSLNLRIQEQSSYLQDGPGGGTHPRPILVYEPETFQRKPQHQSSSDENGRKEYIHVSDSQESSSQGILDSGANRSSTLQWKKLSSENNHRKDQPRHRADGSYEADRRRTSIRSSPIRGQGK